LDAIEVIFKIAKLRFVVVTAMEHKRNSKHKNNPQQATAVFVAFNNHISVCLILVSPDGTHPVNCIRTFVQLTQ
jgi:hypothetical protein